MAVLLTVNPSLTFCMFSYLLCQHKRALKDYLTMGFYQVDDLFYNLTILSLLSAGTNMVSLFCFADSTTWVQIYIRTNHLLEFLVIYANIKPHIKWCSDLLQF
jgi:hypothetical protein